MPCLPLPWHVLDTSGVPGPHATLRSPTMQAEHTRKDRLLVVSLSARAAACAEYHALKEAAAEAAKRLHEVQV